MKTDSRWIVQAVLSILLSANVPLLHGQDSDLGDSSFDGSTSYDGSGYDQPQPESAIDSFAGVSGDSARPEAETWNNSTDDAAVCRLIDGIRVCDNEYKKDEYTCVNFAQDFCKEANAAGVPTWEVWYADNTLLGALATAYTGKCAGHAAVAVLLDDPNTVEAKFCLVEPQSNENYGCWHQENTTPHAPDHVVQNMIDLMRIDPDCVFEQLDASWNTHGPETSPFPENPPPPPVEIDLTGTW